MTDPTPTPDAPAPDLPLPLEVSITDDGTVRIMGCPDGDVDGDGRPVMIWPHIATMEDIPEAEQWAAAIVAATNAPAALRAERDEAQPVAPREIEGRLATALSGILGPMEMGAVIKIVTREMRAHPPATSPGAVRLMAPAEIGLFIDGRLAPTAALACPNRLSVDDCHRYHGDLRQAPKATSPGADRPAERALVVVKYARALRDQWRTAGQGGDSNAFVGAISDVCDAADQFDFGSGKIEQGATSPGAAGDAEAELAEIERMAKSFRDGVYAIADGCVYGLSVPDICAAVANTVRLYADDEHVSEEQGQAIIERLLVECRNSTQIADEPAPAAEQGARERAEQAVIDAALTANGYSLFAPDSPLGSACTARAALRSAKP